MLLNYKALVWQFIVPCTGEHLYTLDRASLKSKFVNSPIEVATSHGKYAIVKDKESILKLNLISRQVLCVYNYETIIHYGRGMAVLPCGSVLVGVYVLLIRAFTK